MTTTTTSHARFIGSDKQLQAREMLYELWRNCPIPEDQLLINLALYMRSGALAKVFFLNEIYSLITDLPGCIMEFGSWWGQSLVVFENLRAMHEPYNYARRLIGFDTFEGYPEPSQKERGKIVDKGAYSVGTDYYEYLDQLLKYHQSENVMSHMQRHELIKGNVAETVPQYFKNNPQTMVALAYFDFALYEPTKACLEHLKSRLMRGSVVAFDELNAPAYPGEVTAVIETLGLKAGTMRRSKFLPDRGYIIID